MKPLKISFLFYSLFLLLGVYIEFSLAFVYIGIGLLVLLVLFVSSAMSRLFVLPTEITFYKDVVLICSVFFCMGLGLKVMVNSKHQKELSIISTFIGNTPKNVRVDAKISEVVKNKESTRFIAELIRVEDTVANSKIMLCFQTSQPNLKPGDIITYYAAIKRINAPKNIGQFDYQRYMKGKEIYIQSYIIRYDVVGEDKYWRYQILNTRRSLMAKVNGVASPLTEDAKGLLLALLLGEKSYISEDIVTSFKDVGVMHILAISGLHVGLIYLVLIRIFFFLPNAFRRVVVLVTLWFFVFLSGFSPSVFRAVFMFSIFTVCHLIRRDQNLEHSVGLALFFSICIYPYWVYDIGFQLSYLAVISIVYFLPMFKKYYSKYTIIKYIQGIVYVSLSVQIGLIPIQLYYFHQFSFIFLLANLIVIPLATVLVILGLLYLSTMWISELSSYLGWLFNRFTDILYQSIAILHQVDYMSFKEIKLTPIQLFFTIISIILFALAYYKKRLRYIAVVMILSIVVQSSELFITENSNKKYRNEVVVPYLSGRRDLVIWIRENEILNIFSRQWGPLYNGGQDTYAQEHGIEKVIYHQAEGILPCSTTDILILDDNKEAYDLPFDTAIIVVANHPKVNFERMLALRKPSKVIFHNSVPYWFKQRCIVLCIEKEIPFHDIYEKGYWSSLL